MINTYHYYIRLLEQPNRGELSLDRIIQRAWGARYYGFITGVELSDLIARVAIKKAGEQAQEDDESG